jgi:hypothetical protein
LTGPSGRPRRSTAADPARVEIDGEHLLDGGSSTASSSGRAVELGPGDRERIDGDRVSAAHAAIFPLLKK